MQDKRHTFKPQLGEIPLSPGVYRFSDENGRVLYIGKAKSLRQRLVNYFQPWDALLPRTRRMLSLAAQVDWTVVATDTEALLLEQQWIRDQLPPYNVVFRDDKSFPYLAVTLGHEAPRLEITRRTNIRGAKFFGPYPKVWALKQTVELLQQAFRLRTCSDADYKRAIASGKPCLAGQIGRCFGPCSQKVTVAEYVAEVTELITFMKRLDSKKVRELEKQMFAAADNHEFERAARLRDQKMALEQVLESNTVVLHGNVDADFFGFYADELSASLHQFVVRGGRIRGEHSWLVDIEIEQQAGDLVLQALQDAYLDAKPPKKIYVSALPAELEPLEQVLRHKRPRGGVVSITVPERGDMAKLLETAVRNAGEHLMRHKLQRANDLTARTDSLAELQRTLGMKQAPLRIECIDVSHLQGTDIVASLVVFEDALPTKSAYRKYKIASSTDDTDSIYQVVARRAKQLQAELAEAEAANDKYEIEIDSVSKSKIAQVQHEKATRRIKGRPQLMIVDGGLPQVNAAARALHEAGITDIALCGIAKRLEELWLPGENFPLILPRNSDALFLVQRLRDEAHRFALTFQRQQRKKQISSTLEQIPGVGAARAQLLLKHFGSVKQVQRATLTDLEAMPRLGKKTAHTVYNYLHNAASSDIETAT